MTLAKILRFIAQMLIEWAAGLEAVEPQQPLVGFTIWLDEGHGGSASGAVDDVDPPRSDQLNSVESAMTLRFGNELSERLKHEGALVFRTRVDDSAVTLDDRTSRINATHRATPLHLCLSIHYNAHSNASAEGIETFVYPTKVDRVDKTWANAIQARLIEYTQATNRGVKTADFHMVRVPKCPAALLELGFITNVAEEAKLHQPEYRASQVDAVVQGIIDVYNQIKQGGTPQ